MLIACVMVDYKMSKALKNEVILMSQGYYRGKSSSIWLSLLISFEDFISVKGMRVELLNKP